MVPKVPPSLDLKDLVAVIRVIDNGARRGAFEGPELSDVGTLRSKILAFIEAHTTQNNEAPNNLAPPPPDTNMENIEQFPKQ